MISLIFAVCAAKHVPISEDGSVVLFHEDFTHTNYYYGYSTFDGGFQYQPNLNFDYMSYDTYTGFKPNMEQYHSDYNIERKIMSLSEVKDCGDCIRGGLTYCVKAPGLGSVFTDQKPEGVCCKECLQYEKNSTYNCSSIYFEELM